MGTQNSIPSELARWFIKGTRRGSEFFLDHWQPPTLEDAWYARVSADPRSFVIADRFVRDLDSFEEVLDAALDELAGLGFVKR